MIAEDNERFVRERLNMVEKQLVSRGITDPHVLEVMGSLPRHLFVPLAERHFAYSDAPLNIGQGQTISQPYIVALMTELLDLTGSDCVLEIGTGSGYQAAVLGKIAAEVHTVEVIPDLAHDARENLSNLGFTNVHVHVGDGSAGWPEAAPYTGILVAAAAPSVPRPLLEQLKEGGKLVIPVGSPGFQNLELWTCKGKEYQRQVTLSVAFVPLRGKLGWR